MAVADMEIRVVTVVIPSGVETWAVVAAAEAVAVGDIRRDNRRYTYDPHW